MATPSPAQIVQSYIDFQWRQFGTTGVLTREHLEGLQNGTWRVEAIEPANMLAMVIRLRGFLASHTEKDIHITYPRDWWESLKQRFAPQWVTRRWPVLMTRHHIEVAHVYPDARIPFDTFGHGYRHVYETRHTDQPPSEDGEE